MKRKILRCLPQFLLFAIQCGFTRGMVGENYRDTRVDEFPSAVAIVRINDNVAIPELCLACSGVLISYRDVLTSAHGVVNEQLSGIKILIGSHDLRSATEYLPSWWTTYEEWAEEYDIQSNYQNNDLCIIRLKNNVTLENIKPAAIARVSRNRIFSEQVEVVGWGKVNSDSVPRISKTAALAVLNNTDCTRRVRSINRRHSGIPENNFCTIGDPYLHVNFGDSGGPLFYRKRYLIAVTRGITPSAIPYHRLAVNLHVDLSCYTNFINHVVFHYN